MLSAVAEPFFAASNPDLVESELSLNLNSAIKRPRSNLHNQIFVTQYGLLNHASIVQSNAENNEISLIQLGQGNQAEFQQQGSENVILLSQYGDNNYAEVIQHGIGNSATIEQLGEQTLTLQQIGNDLAVSVTVI